MCHNTPPPHLGGYFDESTAALPLIGAASKIFPRAQFRGEDAKAAHAVFAKIISCWVLPDAGGSGPCGHDEGRSTS
jgi:hypothetical protein